MAKQRSIVAVMDAIFREIPDDFENKPMIEHTFKSIKQSIPYAAPERHIAFWHQLCEALNKYIGITDHEWAGRVGEIIRGERDVESK